jgi:hypothetical protein
MKSIIVVLQVLLFTVAAGAQQSPAQGTQGTPQVQETPEQSAATKGIKAIVSELQDPGSFRLVRVWTATVRGKKGNKKHPDQPDRLIVCLDYRAKNAMGGYVREMAAMGLDGLPLDDIGRKMGAYIVSPSCLNQTADITEAVAKNLGLKKTSGLVAEWEQ